MKTHAEKDKYIEGMLDRRAAPFNSKILLEVEEKEAQINYMGNEYTDLEMDHRQLKLDMVQAMCRYSSAESERDNLLEVVAEKDAQIARLTSDKEWLWKLSEQKDAEITDLKAQLAASKAFARIDNTVMPPPGKIIGLGGPERL